MTRRSGHLQKASENSSGQKGKITKQRIRRKHQPLPKLECEKFQNQLRLEGVPKPFVPTETPDKGVTTTDSTIQPSLLPLLRSSEDVRVKMVGEEQNNMHSTDFMQRHPRIQPKMRSILLDWLIEVSDAYSLHRQTFYLAQDYFDRFMLTQSNVEKNLLQLIGITCLFIASKMEEASPPKLAHMADVTAGTYYQEEILQMELIVLKALHWNLCPETTVSWLNLYFQTASVSSSFPEDDYLLMIRLLDLCVLHINSLDFQHRVLAASVLSHFIQLETVEKVSGLSKDELQPCVSWMAPFVESVGRFGNATPQGFEKTKDRHNIQTHADYMTMLDDAAQTAVKGDFPTPPNSTEKSSRE
ncbi:G1/S-specific cyclin-E2-like [Odontesthes bonariensis]|uniref:G1/S-specific cyclin-E2-like n=1 Tax=Odontesthes bonariensis TaxID=219752 RepID=UPI003F58DCB3